MGMAEHITTRNQNWALNACARELNTLAVMDDSKVGKPGSPYSVSLLKLASICKGAGRGYIPPGALLESIRVASSHLGVTEHESARMWQRAMKTAQPRFPSEGQD
jgi:hypothetical protein